MQRIEYIDAMRGFTMLLVMYAHILFFSYADSFSSDISMGGNLFLSFNSLFVSFRMPLFFFISGFILFKKNVCWTFSNGLKFIKQKAKVQLIPTFFFLMIYSFVKDASFMENCLSEGKCGYWFTITLFEYFVIYLLFRMFCDYFGKKNGIDWLLLLIVLLIYFISTPTCLKYLYRLNYHFVGFLGLSNLRYFLFFAIGTLVKKYFERISLFMDNGCFMAVWILCFYGISIGVLHHGHFTNSLYSHLYFITSGVLGLMLVFAFFRKYQASFTQECRVGKALQYIGQRTLDIYLLHYFFIPRNLKLFGQFFADNSNPSIELIMSFIFAIIVVFICLVVSNIIRISPILSHYLFGVKKTMEVGNNNNNMVI